MRSFVIILVAIIIAVSGLYFGWQHLLQPVDSSAEAEEVAFSVPEGASVAQIASILEEEGMIRSELAFRFYIRQNYRDISLMAGQYLAETSMTPDEIITMLSEGAVYRETEWFVIPEGYYIELIAYYLN